MTRETRGRKSKVERGEREEKRGSHTAGAAAALGFGASFLGALSDTFFSFFPLRIASNKSLRPEEGKYKI